MAEDMHYWSLSLPQPFYDIIRRFAADARITPEQFMTFVMLTSMTDGAGAMLAKLARNHPKHGPELFTKIGHSYDLPPRKDRQ